MARKKSEKPPVQTEVHLHADQSLTDEAARALMNILQAAYKQIVGKKRGLETAAL